MAKENNKEVKKEKKVTKTEKKEKVFTVKQELNDLTIEQLKAYKFHLIGEIQSLQRKTRDIDKVITDKHKKGA